TDDEEHQYESTMSTRMLRPLIEPMTWRSALAVRPPRPITVPRSSGCTRTSSRLPRRDSTSRTRTSSGYSTIPRTRCSSAGRRTASGLLAGDRTGLLLGLRRGLSRLSRLRLSGLLRLRRRLLGGLVVRGLGRLVGRLRRLRQPSRGLRFSLVDRAAVRARRGHLQTLLGRGQALELLPVAGLLQQPLHGLGRLRANREPVLDPV